MEFSQNEIADKIFKSKQAGYSDDEIFNFLKKSPGISEKISTSLERGYSPEEIIQFLGKETSSRNISRILGSAITGLANASPPGILSNLLQLFGQGEALGALEEDLSPERLKDLREKFPGFGVPESIDQGKFKQAISGATESFPTPGNIGSFLEKTLGIPFEARTPSQKGVKFISEVAGFSPGSIPSKIARGLTGQAIESGLEESGVPEGAAEAIAFPLSLSKIPKGAKGVPSKRSQAIETGSKEFEKAFKKTEEGLFGQSKKQTQQVKDLSQRIPQETARSVEETYEAVKNRFSSPKNYEERISKHPFKSSEGAVGEVRAALKDIEKSAEQNFSKRYENLNYITKKIQIIPQEIYKETQKIIDNLNPNRLASLNPKEQKFVKVLDDLQNRFAERMPGGEPIGFKPITLQDLIEYKRAIGSSKNLDPKFKHLYGLMEEEISNNLKNRSNALFERYKTLNKEYSEFKDLHDKDIINRLRDKKDTSYNSIYNQLIESDNLRDLSNVLSKSQRGREVLKKARRDFFNKNISKVESPLEIKNFKDLLGIENQRIIDSALSKRKGIPNILKSSPEELLSKMNSKSSIRNIKSELEKINGGKELFNKLKEAKIEEILSSNKITSKSSVKELFNILNDRKNFEILSELQGFDKTYEDFLKAENLFEKQGHQEFLRSSLSKIAKKGLREIAKQTFLYRILKIFIPYSP